MKRINNKGSVTLEATIILPIFIFFMLVMFHIIRLRMAEAILYEAAIETVEYMAEITYLEECNDIIPKTKLKEYIDNEAVVEKYIVGGVDGVSFDGSIYLDAEGYVWLNISYEVGIKVPIIGDLSGERNYVIRQKAYIGEMINGQNQAINQDEIYVYITDNREAYHTTRSCSHLDLSITPATENLAETNGYSPCGFCGGGARGVVLITNYGNRYHSKNDCIGLKRTVYRVKKSQVEGLGACRRCGN